MDRFTSVHCYEIEPVCSDGFFVRLSTCHGIIIVDNFTSVHDSSIAVNNVIIIFYITTRNINHRVRCTTSTQYVPGKGTFIETHTTCVCVCDRTMNAEAAVLVKAQWRALSAMALANAFHFGAYELARSAISALFTSSHSFSSSSSYGNASTMMTLAIGCVSPCSIILLAVHRTVFDRCGPQLSLRYTTMIYAISLSVAAVILRYCCIHTGSSESSTGLKQYLAQGTIIFIFIMKNSFVQLLASQHWSFITGILTATSSKKTTTLPVFDSDRWTTIIAGIGSVVATLCGWTIEPFLNLFQHDGVFHAASDHNNNTNFDGLTALLICAALIMVLATVCSDEAYRVAHKVRWRFPKVVPYIHDRISVR